MTRSLICGAGGFIAGHLAKALLDRGDEVLAVDIKPREEWWQWHEGVKSIPNVDLRITNACKHVVGGVDEVYQLAADMGGALYAFSGDNDADIMHNSAMINLNFAELAKLHRFRIFWSSSACIYPKYNQTDPSNPNCIESSAYPAACDSNYGWEKLFSENLYDAYARNYGITVRIARFHNIMGNKGSWKCGKEKAPAAICRKVAQAKLTGNHKIEIWGNGNQTRSFCWIGDCVKGILDVMNGPYPEPVNLGSTEMVTINQLVDIAEEIAGIKLERVYNLGAPTGVAGRNSENTEFKRRYGWEPNTPLRYGMEVTYKWIEEQLKHDQN